MINNNNNSLNLLISIKKREINNKIKNKISILIKQSISNSNNNSNNNLVKFCNKILHSNNNKKS